MNEKRLHRCCFTGHRPEKLHMPEHIICGILENTIEKSVNEGFYVFISGMARGFDIYAAEVILKLKHINSDIKLICASPFEGFEKSWQLEWQQRYKRIMMEADLIRYINPGYSRECFQTRNMWMIDRSSRLIACYNGENGGTKNTIRYAEKSGLEIINIL